MEGAEGGGEWGGAGMRLFEKEKKTQSLYHRLEKNIKIRRAGRQNRRPHACTHAHTCSQLKGAQEMSNLECLSARRRGESKPSAADKTPIFRGGAAQINLIMDKIISPLELFHSLVPRLKWQITRIGGRWRLSPAPGSHVACGVVARLERRGRSGRES